jgi:hypothetical protein
VTLRIRPRAPWYSTGTRRLALIRVGLPTLLACAIAIGPTAAAKTPSIVPPQVAAIVTSVTTTARQALDLHAGNHGAGGDRAEATSHRSGHGR